MAKNTGTGQARVRSMQAGRMVQCSGHGGDPCARHARMMKGFDHSATWACGEPKPLVQKHRRVGQQKQAKKK